MAASSLRDKERLTELLAAKVRLERRRALDRYKPYPKQYEFHAVRSRERLFMAGNQEGKTFCGAREVAIHATGRYPDWWPGRRFTHPVVIWTGQTTNEKSKEIIQPALLGIEGSNKKDPRFGTGALPGDDIVNITTRQAGVKEVVDTITVKHYTDGVHDGNSHLSLKTYEQGRETWQGKVVHVVWSDEECPPDVYSEAVVRTQTVNGIVLVTFTPLKGMTETVMSFLEPEPGAPPKSVTTMTIYDCIGGTWPQGTPWEGDEWTGHYTREQADTIVASYPAHERETRAFGVPMVGIGRVIPFQEMEYTCQPFEIPPHFARIKGCDFGFNHPGAGCELAIDRDNDTIYVVWSYRKAEETPVYHALILQQNRPWVPIAWPHDGLNAERSGGASMMTQYRRAGANMMHISARYDDESGGRQDVEPIVQQMIQMIRIGKLKIFANQTDLLDELRFWHRDRNGKIVATREDIISALRYALMMRRYARAEGSPVRRSRYTKPILSSRAA